MQARLISDAFSQKGNPVVLPIHFFLRKETQHKQIFKTALQST